MITFWSQFASFALNTILILFLTRPLIAHGLGYEYVDGGHGQLLQLLHAAVDDVDGRRAAVAVNKALQGGERD